MRVVPMSKLGKSQFSDARAAHPSLDWAFEVALAPPSRHLSPLALLAGGANKARAPMSEITMRLGGRSGRRKNLVPSCLVNEREIGT